MSVNSSPNRHWLPLAALCTAASAAIFALFLRAKGPALAQIASGEDALSVAFGDTKATISRAMVHKADSYFHSGMDTKGVSFADPYCWINDRVHADTGEHCHLEGEKAVELLPWLWAAVRSDPSNVDAWTTAIYVAGREMGNRALAARLIAEARLHNPDSLELAWKHGMFLYDSGKGDLRAAREVFLTARELARKLSHGDVSRLGEHDRTIEHFIEECIHRIDDDIKKEPPQT